MGRKTRRLFSARLLSACALFTAASIVYGKIQHYSTPRPLLFAEGTAAQSAEGFAQGNAKNPTARPCTLQRAALLKRLQEGTRYDESSPADTIASYDVVVVGGGAAGLFCALDGAARGYTVLLLEKDDIGVATSSMQLLNGSVMHMEKGIRQRDLIAQSSNAATQLSELRTLERIAPRYVRPISLVVPFTRWNEGLELWISGKLASLTSLASVWRHSQLISGNRLFSSIVPSADPDSTRVCGAVRVPQCIVDDTRCCVALAQTASDAGANMLTHCRIINLHYRTGDETAPFFVVDAQASDTDAKGSDCVRQLRCRARYIIDAAGPCCGDVWKLVEGVDLPEVVLGHKQALQLVLRSSDVKGFCTGTEGEQGVVVSGEEQSARSFFVVPAWKKGYALVGTAFGALQETTARTNMNDIDSITAALATFNIHVDRNDVLGAQRRAIALLNPDVQQKLPVIRDVVRNDYGVHTMWATERSKTIKEELAKKEQRDTVEQPSLPIVTLFGCSWTTSRLMAQIAFDTISSREQDRTKKRCGTRNILFHGCENTEQVPDTSDDGTPNSPLKFSDTEIERAVDSEFCLSVVDFIARRSDAAYTHGRQLLRDADAPTRKRDSDDLSTVHHVAHIMGQKLHWNAKKQQAEVARAVAFLEHIVPPIASS